MAVSRRLATSLLLGCLLGLMGAAQEAPASAAKAPAPGTAAIMLGEDQVAEGRFADAANAYAQAVAEDPVSVPALVGLAQMRLYQHREKEAAALAGKAVALAPDNSLAAQVLKTVETWRASFSSDVYRISPAERTTVVHFVTTDPLPVVNVRVDGHPASFLVDTGAPDIALNPTFAQSLGLRLTQGGVGVFAGGRQAQVEHTTARDLQIGALHVGNVPAAINPAELPGLHTEGVIGAGLLMHVLATIDYCRGRLVLAPRSTSAAFERRAAASGANIMPMWLVGDHFIFARAEINGVEGLFSIDTGLAGGGLVATKSMLDAARIVLDNSKAGEGQGGGGTVRFVPFRAAARLGTLARSDVPGVYMPEGDPYGMFRFKVAGALSHSFFNQSRITFDFDAMKLVTENCKR